MSIPATAEVVIIGGGVMGASTAYHLALAGQSDVVLLEREELFGQGATGRSSGGVRYQFSTEVNVRLSLASLPMLERFEEETGQEVDYHPCGYLFMLTTAAQVEAFRASLKLQHRLGVQSEWLEGDQIRERLPFMRLEDVLAGTFHARDGLADPNGVVMGYLGRARDLGVEAVTEAEVTAIDVEAGQVRGVSTSRGAVAAPAVVNAAGPWAARIGRLAGVEIPITPLRRQWLITTALPEIPDDFPFVIDFARGLYFHREGDGLLLGMGNPEQEPGLDQSVDPDWEATSLEAAAARLPLLEKASRRSNCAGLYEVTPDAHPIFGETPVKGFYVCGGFSGHGFMHGPVAGKLMAEILLEGRSRTVDVSMLDLARFAAGRLIREYNVV